MNKNIEDVVMNGEVKTEIPTDAVDSGLGKTVAKVILIGTGAALLVKGAIWAGKKVVGAFASKKAKTTDVVVNEYNEVPCEEEVCSEEA